MAKKKLIIIIILVATALLIAFLPGYTRLQDLVSENRQLEERINRLQESMKELADEKDRLENDIIYIEKVAREKMGLIKKGERVLERKESSTPH